MSDRSELRATDAEREQAVDRLRAAASDGRLTVEELAERADLAYRAVTLGDLLAVTGDLGHDDDPDSLPPDTFEEHAVFGGWLRRGGRWEIARRSRWRATVGRIALDLRGATLPGPTIDLELDLVLSTARIVVPEGARVAVHRGGTAVPHDIQIREGPSRAAPEILIATSGVGGSLHVRSRRR